MSTSPSGSRIAILEDDATQSMLMSGYLDRAGFTCRIFDNGIDVLKALRSEQFDLLTLDWRVPGVSGMEILVWVRQNFGNALPVLFVTVLNEEKHIVEALEAGADDFLTKPFDGNVLVARAKALMRRVHPTVVNAIEIHHPYRFDTKQQMIHFKVDGVEHVAEMTRKEFDMALLMFRNIGRAVSKVEIREKVWSAIAEINSRTVDTHATKIRQKLKLVPEHGFRLTNVYRFGYRLDQLPRAEMSKDSEINENQQPDA